MGLIEFFLAYLLISTKAKPIAYTAILIFLLSGFSLTVLSSLSTFRCGCIGPFEVDGISKFVFLVAMTCVALMLPLQTELGNAYSLAITSVTDSKIRFKMFYFILVWASLSFLVGTPEGRNLAGFADRFVRVEDGSVLDLGSNHSNSVVSRRLIIQNVSRDSDDLLGGSASCNCITVVGPFPQRLSADSRTEVQIEINLKGKGNGPFAHKITFFLSAPNQPRMSLPVSGHVHD